MNKVFLCRKTYLYSTEVKRLFSYKSCFQDIDSNFTDFS